MGFHSVSLTLRTLFVGVAGRFNYAAMSKAAPVFAPVYMTSWLLTIGFCLSSVFVAVLAQSFSSVRDTIAKQESLIASSGCRVIFASLFSRFRDAVISRIPSCVFGQD